MNKSELIERLAARLGDQKASSTAVDAMVTEIENAVSAGDKVNISGFGVFERRDRAARTSRNPRTGEPIQVKQTSVPAFRPGQTFKTLVAGGGEGGKGQRGGQSARAQASRSPQAKSQPAKSQQAKSQPARSQPAKSQAGGRAQPAKAQTGRAQAPRAQAQSRYSQTRYSQSRYGSTAKQAGGGGRQMRARAK